MARRREIATLNSGPRHHDEDAQIEPNRTAAGAVGHSETRPETFFEALMQCAPGQEPDPSRDELLPLRDILQDAIDRLTPKERWIFDALTSRKLSLRQCAAELALSKSQVQRDRDVIYMKLRTMLIESPNIREYLCR